MLGRTPKDANGFASSTKCDNEKIRQQFNHQDEKFKSGLSTDIQTTKCFGQSNHSRYTCKIPRQSGKASCLSNVLRNMCTLARGTLPERNPSRNESVQTHSQLMTKNRWDMKTCCRHQASGLG